MNTLQLSKMLAYEHFEAEPALTKLAIFTAENDQEIRLLEVNNDAMPSGCVQPFVFRPSGNCPLPVFVADVTPKEWEDVKELRIELPKGWPRQPVEVIDRATVLEGTGNGP